MAWGTKAEEKPAGETPTLNVDELVTKLRTTFNEDLKTSLKTQEDSFNARFQTIEEKFTRPATPPGEPAALPSVWDDENAAFNTRIAPVYGEVLQLRAQNTENEVLNEVRAKGLGD